MKLDRQKAGTRHRLLTLHCRHPRRRRDRQQRVGQRQQGERSHRRKADAQVERPDSRRPRSAVADPMLNFRSSGSTPESCHPARVVPHLHIDDHGLQPRPPRASATSALNGAPSNGLGRLAARSDSCPHEAVTSALSGTAYSGFLARSIAVGARLLDPRTPIIRAFPRPDTQCAHRSSPPEECARA